LLSFLTSNVFSSSFDLVGDAFLKRPLEVEDAAAAFIVI
jgi:hypothetical protein